MASKVKVVATELRVGWRWWARARLRHLGEVALGSSRVAAPLALGPASTWRGASPPGRASAPPPPPARGEVPRVRRHLQPEVEPRAGGGRLLRRFTCRLPALGN
ncbi:UNVERIFIED_CONTAM: hypothetical protein Slati_2971300 [Sesamum latifolium]|uniref:Uncharacterized protein n=1 Tax=Sesamum latifolium TaxID=2727402 RepID=A0AAW2VI74_9LAMI